MPVLHAPRKPRAREGVNHYLVIEAQWCPCRLWLCNAIGGLKYERTSVELVHVLGMCGSVCTGITEDKK
jgi:hypothetical protein